MGDITINLPDGSERSLPDGSTAGDLAAAIGPGLAKAAVVAEVDGVGVDLNAALTNGATVAIVTDSTAEGLEVIRHSTAHVLAQAVLELFPGATHAIGPPIENGFYYDFDLPDGGTFSEDDLERIDARMREIIAADQDFVRGEVSAEEGLELFAEHQYKREIIENVDPSEVGGDGRVSFYRNGDGFIDLCRGPHVPSTGRLGHFALQKVAGAYWRGDEHNQMLQRIYGTAWASKKELKAHLHMLVEAEKRDHRKLGAELDLFSFPSEIGSGLAVFHPKGGIVRRIMEDYSRDRHAAEGYEFVNSPHITKGELFETSGHLEWYADGMFPPMTLDDEHGNGSSYYLKPMNCPFHILIFQSGQRSYRELPLRMFEFGAVYRYEKSGTLHGLTRVRGLTMDDAHIFTTREAMTEELTSLLNFVLGLLRDYGLDDFYLELSTKPEVKAVGTDDEWNDAIECLRVAAEGMDLELVLDEGGGAFYGPKISVQARDAIGRSWQMSTIQVDFQLPQRFGLEYIGADGGRHQPIMIHRALFGSVERFFAVLLEHYAGKFPTWLAPVQARVLGVRDDHDDHVAGVVARLAEAGLRVDSVRADEPLGGRIRRAKMEKLPYILVVGDDDVANNTVGVNPRGGDVDRDVALEDFVTQILAEVEAHTSPDA
jgi:threonyl-tRNA synthetase